MATGRPWRYQDGARSAVMILTALTALPYATAPAAAGVIVDHTPNAFDARYDRFSGGFPTAPVPNDSPSFVGSGLNLSGVGWTLANGFYHPVAMVSERHYIGAAHVFLGPGSQVSFYDAVANTVRTYSVQTVRRPTTTFTNNQGQQQTLPSDVQLGTLSTPIPESDHINFFPVAAGPTDAFVGQPLLSYGQNANYGIGNQVHLGRNNVTEIGNSSFDGPTPVNEATSVFTYDYTPANSGEFYLIGGDSGGPTFTPAGGTFALLGGHYGVSNNTPNPNPGDLSVDSFLPFYISQLNAFMAQDTDATHPNGYALTIAPVPEPGTVGLTATVTAVVVVVGLRRRRKGTMAA